MLFEYLLYKRHGESEEYAQKIMDRFDRKKNSQNYAFLSGHYSALLDEVLSTIECIWKPIRTAPIDGSRIIAWHESWNSPLCVYHYSRGWTYDSDLGPMKEQPTHWMYLPLPPAGSP